MSFRGFVFVFVFFSKRSMVTATESLRRKSPETNTQRTSAPPPLALKGSSLLSGEQDPGGPPRPPGRATDRAGAVSTWTKRIASKSELRGFPQENLKPFQTSEANFNFGQLFGNLGQNPEPPASDPLRPETCTKVKPTPTLGGSPGASPRFQTEIRCGGGSRSSATGLEKEGQKARPGDARHRTSPRNLRVGDLGISTGTSGTVPPSNVTVLSVVP